MFFEYACHLLVREGVDWLILAVVLAWRMISLQLRDSAGLSNEDHRLRLYTHPSGGLGTRAAVVILIVLYKLRRQPSREEVCPIYF